MQVKVFEAEDMRSALEKVKQALGPEALILSTRSIAKGRFGMTSKNRIEVTAAVDGGGEAQDSRTAAAAPKPSPTPAGYGRGAYFETLLDETSAPAEAGKGRNGREKAAASKDGNAGTEEGGSLYEELRQMRRSFQGLAKELARVKSSWPKAEASAPSGRDGGATDQARARLAPFHGLGIHEAVLEQFAGILTEGRPDDAAQASEAAETDPPAETDDPAALLAGLLAETIRFEDLLAAPWQGQKRMALIGPTGVGKTTSIAKVAANYMLAGGRKVVLATIDNYRIAAVEQLKIYGRIMNMPVEVARAPEELSGIFERHADADLVLVDTAGRSPRDDMRQQELAAFLDPALGIENHLVLSATTGETELYTVIDRFSHLNLHGLVVTKLDECDFPGQIVNLGVQGGYPLSLLTNGQKVPEDLLPSEPREVAKEILNRDEVVEKWNMEETETRPERCAH
jgi:flagellar biosynthesis protein FlhF